MKYGEKTFTVPALPTKEYRDNWEKIFGKKVESKQEEVQNGPQ